MKATYIKADGTIEEITPKNGEHFTLEELQEFVGGYITYAPQPIKGKDMVLIANEEGLMLKLEPNLTASTLAGRFIVGDVLYCPQKLVQ